MFLRNLLNCTARRHASEHTHSYCQIALCVCVILRDVTTSQLTLGCACIKVTISRNFVSLFLKLQVVCDVSWAAGPDCDRSKRRQLYIVLNVEMSVPEKG
jgi:hypothetical protein